MRGRSTMPWVLAGLCLSALLVHLLVPLGQFTVTTAAGTQKAFLYAIDLHYIGDDRVALTGMASMLVGLGLLTLGGFTLAASTLFKARKDTLFTAGGVATGIGAALSLVSQGLWTGRLVSATIHKITGTDGPPMTFQSEGWAGPDVGYTAWIVSPAIVLVLVLATIYLLGRIWITSIPDTRSLPQAARDQHRILFTAAVAITIALLVPWSAVELNDATGDDVDLYFWSAYDVLMIHDASEARALESNEFGIMQYRGLAALLLTIMTAGLGVLIATTFSLTGIRLDAQGKGVTGRLLENATFLAVLGIAFLAVAAVLGAFWLHRPNDFHEATITAMPLAILVPLGWTVTAALRTVTRLVAEDNDLLADDFPEPILYD